MFFEIVLKCWAYLSGASNPLHADGQFFHPAWVNNMTADALNIKLTIFVL